MDRVITVEDKIRKAEEIYYRRRGSNIPIKEEVRNNNRDNKNMKYRNKMIRQIIICLVIYSIFNFMTSQNYIFSANFIQKTREILNQDINFSQIYSSLFNKEKTKEEIQNNDENIGGATDESIEENTEEIVDTTSKEAKAEIVEKEETKLSQMELDANYIKSTINFIKPVEGTISSMFGVRNPTTPTVPKNHTGTDIAAKTGTKIVSATNGRVVYTSSSGDFGNHLKIQTNDIIILYAHCNKIYVNEGEEIKQGQEIAEVGSPGNTTGPHLHFEIKYQERYIDPQLILQL